MSKKNQDHRQRPTYKALGEGVYMRSDGAKVFKTDFNYGGNKLPEVAIHHIFGPNPKRMSHA